MFECLPVFELYKEIEQFLRHRGSGIAGHFENEEFVVSLAYLPDIFSHQNDLNTSIRVTTMYMITASESVSACTNKLSTCISCTYADFPQLGEVSKEKYPYSLTLKYKSICKCYGSPSKDTFRLQPGEISVSQGWMRDRTRLFLT